MKQFAPILLLLVPALAACRKNDKTGPATAECRAATMIVDIGTVTSVFSFSYDNDGKVSRIVNNQDEMIFEYGANGYVVRFLSAGKMFRHTTVSTDDRQRPVSAKILDYRPDGTFDTENVTCEYNAKNELVRQVSQKNGQPAVATATVWADGNCVAISDNSQSIALTYYSDKPAQQADVFRVNQLLLYGYVNVFNKNLAKSMKTPLATTDISYDFDAAGRITTVRLETGVRMEKRSFQYDCD